MHITHVVRHDVGILEYLHIMYAIPNISSVISKIGYGITFCFQVF